MIMMTRKRRLLRRNQMRKIRIMMKNKARTKRNFKKPKKKWLVKRSRSQTLQQQQRKKK